MRQTKMPLFLKTYCRAFIKIISTCNPNNPFYTKGYFLYFCELVGTIPNVEGNVGRFLMPQKTSSDS